jgi:hypothetical protein
MNSSLPIQRYPEVNVKGLANIVPIRPVIKPSVIEKEKLQKTGIIKEVPHFYTKPIFKAKKHDFL